MRSYRRAIALIALLPLLPPPADAVGNVPPEIINTLGFIRRVVPLRRNGSFAPGTEVGGPANVQDVGSARANCVIDGENTHS